MFPERAFAYAADEDLWGSAGGGEVEAVFLLFEGVALGEGKEGKR